MDAPPPTAPTLTPTRLRAWARALAIVALLLAPQLPLVGAGSVLVAAGLPDYALDGDGALVELRVRAAADGTQLLGSYSRLGFDHPGPLHFYLCVPFYAAADGRTAGLNLAALTLQSLALLAALGLAFRAGGLRLLAAGSLVTTAYIATLGQILLTIWDPALAIVPLLACLIASAAFAGGRVHAAVAVALTATFAIHAHLSLVPPVGAAVGAAALLHLIGRSRRTSPPASRAVLTAVAVALPAWGPPIYEQLTRSPGNLTRIATALGGDGARPAFAQACAITAERSTSFARELLGLGDGPVIWVVFGLQIALLVAAIVVARRRGDRAVAALGVITLAVLAAAVLAVHRIVGDVRPHMLQWIVTAGVAIWWTVLAAVLPGARVGWRIAAGIAVSAGVALGVVRGGERLLVESLVFVGDPSRAASTPALGPSLDRIAAVLRRTETATASVRVLAADDPAPENVGFTIGAGLVLGLHKRGITVLPEPMHAFAFPDGMPRPDVPAARITIYEPSTRGLVDRTGPLWDDVDLGTWGFAVDGR